MDVAGEDSYTARRQIFKNVWDIAMNMDDKDAAVMNKPKVIKTLRLDELSRSAVNKRKKLKLKNLRTVCNKLLDFCDKQEVADHKFKKVKADGEVVLKVKKKRKKARGKSFRTKDPTQAQSSSLEKKKILSTSPAKKVAKSTFSARNRNSSSAYKTLMVHSSSARKSKLTTNGKSSRSPKNSLNHSEQSSHRT